MFLLSRFPLDINSQVNKNEFRNRSIEFFDEISYKSFFVKSLINCNSYCDIEPVDNMHTIAYKVSCVEKDSFKILHKVDLSKHIKDILLELKNKRFDFYNYTPEYLYYFVLNNNELKFILKDYFYIIEDILKNSLNESIYSVSSIRKLIEVSEHTDFIYKESFLKEYVDECSPNHFYSFKILDDLIFFAKNTNSINLGTLEYMKEIKWREEFKINPF